GGPRWGQKPIEMRVQGCEKAAAGRRVERQRDVDPRGLCAEADAAGFDVPRDDAAQIGEAPLDARLRAGGQQLEMPLDVVTHRKRADPVDDGERQRTTGTPWSVR